MILLAFAALGAVGVLVIVMSLLPVDTRRGAAVVIALAALTSAAAATAPETVRDTAVLGSATVLVVGLIAGGRRPSQSTTVVVVGIAFLLVVETTTVLTFPIGSLLFARLAVIGTLTLLLVSGFTAREWHVLVAALIGLGVVQAGLGVLEFAVVHRPIPWGYKHDASGVATTLINTLLPGGRYRVSGSLGHPIPYAMVLMSALVVVVGTARRRPVVVSVSLALVLATALVLSGSRSVLIAGLVAGSYLLWTSGAPGRSVRLLITVLVAMAAVILFAGELTRATDRLVESGSFWNRTGSLAAVPRLVSRPPLEAAFGSGFGSELELYTAGYLQQNGFFVIDNQLVTTIATEGIVGAGLVIALIVVAFVHGDRIKRALLLVSITMLFSFDFFGWPAMFCLFLAVAALPATVGGTPSAIDPPDQAEPTPADTPDTRTRLPEGTR